MSLILTNSQEVACVEGIKWFGDYTNRKSTKQYFSISGAPGTGKTTLVKVILDKLGLREDEYIACAYVGKVVTRLLQGGINACTLHSLIYDFLFEKIEMRGNKPKYKMVFKLKTRLPKNIRVIIVDEATMVNDAMCDELLSFGIPVIFVGDTNQLPPIFGISSIMKKPDCTLIEIMRQSEDDPIVQFCQDILKGRPFRPGIYGNSKIVETLPVDKDLIINTNQFLTCTNAHRQMINDFVRKDILGYNDSYPRLYDKVICRQNRKDESCYGFPLTNGTTGFIINLDRDGAKKNSLVIDFKPEFFVGTDRYFSDLQIDTNYLTTSLSEVSSLPANIFSELIKFEYAYAISVHLSQGSEYDNVVFYDRPFGDYEFRKRLRYTAVSRAKQSIIIASDIELIS